MKRLGSIELALLLLPLLLRAEDADGIDWPQDCNTGNAAVFAGAPERCDGEDNDCDGGVDEGCLLACAASVAYASASTAGGAGASYSPVAARTRDGVDVAWVDERDGFAEIYLQSFDRFLAPLDVETRVSTAPAAAYDPAIVSTGEYRLIAWADERSGRPQILYTRCCSGAGNELQQNVTSDPLADAVEPDAAWGGWRWAVAYAAGSGASFAVYTQLIDDQGGGVSPARTEVSDGTSGLARRPALVYNGSGYGVVWQDDRHGDDEIYLRTLDADLATVSGEVRVTTASGTSRDADVAWSGSRYAVAWTDERDGNAEIYAAVFDAAGVPVGSELRVTTDANASEGARLAATDDEFLLLWRDDAGGSVTLTTARIGEDGSLLEGPRAVSAAGPFGAADLAWLGDAPVAVHDDLAGGSIELLRRRCCGDVDGDGFDRCADDCDDGRAALRPGAAESCNGFDDDCDAEIDNGCPRLCGGPDRIQTKVRHQAAPTSSNHGDVSIAWDGTSIGAAWTQRDGGLEEVVFQLLEEDGTEKTAPFVIADAQESYTHAFVVAEPGGFGLFYSGFVSGGDSDLLFRRFDGGGTPLGQVRRYAFGDDFVDEPVAVWDGRGYAVAWAGDTVRFLRLSADGVPIGDAFTIATTSDQPALAWNGSEYLLVWHQSNYGLIRRRFDAEGAPIQGPFDTVVDNIARFPHLSATDEGYLLLFVTSSEVRRLRLQQNGVPNGTVGTLEAELFDSFIHPISVWNGDEYYAHWTNLTDGEVRAERITPTGNGGGPIFTAADESDGDIGFAGRHGLTWTGRWYVAAWNHAGDAGIPGMYTQRWGCCPGGDPDGDLSCLEDCDEGDPLRYPGAPERCNGLDDDCDMTVVGEGPFSVVTNLVFDDAQTLRWDDQGGGVLYDTQRGGVESLRGNGGDFDAATELCLEADGSDATSTDADVPLAGDGFWYLVGGGSDRCPGTYESGGTGQSGTRDEEVAGSANACP